MGVNAEVRGTARSRLRLDPRTKILFILAVSLVAMVGYRGPIVVVKPFFLALPFLLLAFSGQLASAIKFATVFFFAAYWQHILFFLPQDGAVGSVLRLVFMLIVSFMPCLVAGAYIVKTTTVSAFIAALQKMHVSQKITIPFVVLFRFFPTIAEEYRFIQDAMRIRGVGMRKGPIAMLEYRLVPLMISIVKIGDDLSAAAATRGLGDGEKRTSVCEIGFGVLDAGIALFSVAILVVLLFGVMG